MASTAGGSTGPGPRPDFHREHLPSRLLCLAWRLRQLRVFGGHLDVVIVIKLGRHNEQGIAVLTCTGYSVELCNVCSLFDMGA
jgi:hypothetical protein